MAKHWKPLADLLTSRGADLADLLIECHNSTGWLTEELAILGVTGSTIFPDLDHLAHDLSRELGDP